jgi:hypothetical protein
VPSSRHPQREDAVAAHGSVTGNEPATRDVEAALRFHGHRREPGRADPTPRADALGPCNLPPTGETAPGPERP